MRILAVILGLLLLLLQYRLWISEQGKREVWRLTQAVDQIVTPATPAPAAPATSLTARTQ
jgi:cell division protein FtsB